MNAIKNKQIWAVYPLPSSLLRIKRTQKGSYSDLKEKNVQQKQIRK